MASLGSSSGSSHPWSKRAILSLVLALALFGAAPLLSGCFGAPARAGVLQGRVTTYTGGLPGKSPKPLAGVKVTFGGKSATTGPDGQYTLSGVPDTAGTLVASKPGAYPAQDFPVGAGRSGGKLDLSLKNLHQLYAQKADKNTLGAVPGTKRAGNGNACDTCHAAQGGAIGDFLLKADTNALCSNADCHPASVTGFVHPAQHLDPANNPGVKPPGRYAGYPNLSCLACHRPHKDSDQWVEAGLLATARMSLANSCVQCHATLPSTHPSTGGQPCSQCHATDGVPRGHATCSGYSGKYGTPCHASSTTIATGKHADPAKLPNGCSSCHNVAGTSNPKLLRWPNDAGLCYQAGCHAGLAQPDLTVAGHRKCTALCHDPHRVEIGMVTNPANPSGPLLSVPHETYRGVSRVPNSYCTTCHRATPPAGFEAAKDAYTESQFTNNEVKPDKVLHRVHVEKVRMDYPPYAGRSYDHPEYPYKGDVNKVRCAMCHSVHPTARGLNLLPTVILSRTKSGTGYTGKAGCGVGAGCHTCAFCHSSPGGPGVDCTCYHSAGYHGIVY